MRGRLMRWAWLAALLLPAAAWGQGVGPGSVCPATGCVFTAPVTAPGLIATGTLAANGLATLSGGWTSTGSNLTGTLTGANSQLILGGGGVRTYAGVAAVSQATLQLQAILRGSVTSGLQPMASIWSPDDGALVGSGEIKLLDITDTLTANATGKRWGADISVGNSAALAAGSSVGMGGVRAQVTGQFNMGGTDTTFGGSLGQLFGANITANAIGTATNLRNVTGLEIDIGLAAGASAYSREGLKIVLLSTDANAGAVWDYGFSIQAQNAQTAGHGLTTAMVFGGNGGFGLDPTGTMINAFVGAGGMLAGIGIDFSGVTFSTAFLKSTGFTVDGTGIVTAAAYKVGATAGVTCASVTAASVTVANGIVTHC